MTWFREVQRPCAEALWGRAMATLPDPAAAFGPRWREHPRPGERTWAVVDDRGALLGVGSLEPAGPGAASYCVCLLPEARGRGVRLRVRELAAGPWTWGGVSGDPPEAAFAVSRAAWETRR